MTDAANPEQDVALEALNTLSDVTASSIDGLTEARAELTQIRRRRRRGWSWRRIVSANASPNPLAGVTGSPRASLSRVRSSGERLPTRFATRACCSPRSHHFSTSHDSGSVPCFAREDSAAPSPRGCRSAAAARRRASPRESGARTWPLGTRGPQESLRERESRSPSGLL